MKEIQDVPAGRAANHRAFGYFLVEIVASMAEISQSLDDPAVGAASQRKSSFNLVYSLFLPLSWPRGVWQGWREASKESRTAVCHFHAVLHPQMYY